MSKVNISEEVYKIVDNASFGALLIHSCLEDILDEDVYFMYVQEALEELVDAGRIECDKYGKFASIGLNERLKYRGLI